MKKVKLLTTAILLFLSLNTYSKIRLVGNNILIGGSATNIDIDQNGLWDFKIIKDAWDNYKIQLAYQDESNYSAIRVISATQQTPVPFPYEADITGAGTWIYSIDQDWYLIEDFVGQGTKYIGVKLMKSGVSYCSWIQIYNGVSSLLGLGYYAWEDDQSNCLWAGQTSRVSVNIDTPVAVSFSPNPAKNSVFINGSISPVDVNIYNSIGEIVLSFNQVYSNSPLDISTLRIGIYYFYIQVNSSSYKKKLIVNR